MSIVKHHTLDQALASVSPDQRPNLFLIYGESYLSREAFKKLKIWLAGPDAGEYDVETLDGASTPVGDIVEQTATFSFLTARKIIAVNRIPLFQEDSTASVRYTQTEYQVLENFIQSGWPAEHILVLITGQGDKRKKIFKTIEKHGLVIDCTVPGGARKADKDEQRAVLQHVTSRVLNRHGKQIDGSAFHTLVGRTGFNLDTLVLNLEKLAAFTADRPRICVDDVEKVVVKEKKDPIFSLTNALLERDGRNALTVLDNLKADGFHVLQVLKTLENQFRKLIRIRDFSIHAYPDGPRAGQMSFNQFKQVILPAVVRQDQAALKAFESQEITLGCEKVRKKDVPQDLFLAPNPKNAYPVFQTFQKSENFSLNELCHILLFLSDLDFRLKTSSIDAMTQIENLIIRVCSKGGFVYAEKN